jgi:orotate phosphoribosyltransferase
MTTSILSLLEHVNAIITHSHVVYTSGRHGSSYVNKDALYPHTRETSYVCSQIAEQCAELDIEVVAGPTIGGVVMSQWVAYHLTRLTGREVLAVYAEEEGVTGYRIFRRGYENILPSRRVLVVEDIVTTGGSVRKVITAAQALGATVVGVGVLCNRGSVTAARLNVPHFLSLVNVPMESWDAHECPLCQSGVPINTRVGKGALFLAQQHRNTQAEPQQ